MNELERAKYYTYDLSKQSTMVHHEPPYLEPYFNRELLKLGGKDIFGDPILRIVWAGTLPETKYHEDVNGITKEYKGMKYAFIKRNVVTGYSYLNDKGQKVTVTDLNLVPPGKVSTRESYMDELGQMKWAVEMKYSAEDLVTLGYYPPLDSKRADQWCVRNGQRYRVKPNRQGDYLLAFFIETPEGGYRDVRESDLERIRYVWQRAHSETDEAFTQRKMEEIEAMLELEKIQRAEKLDSALGDAIIRAEKLPINPIHFIPTGK